MKKGTHGKDEKSFEELDYVGQARSLNAQIMVLKKALNAHVRKAQIDGKNNLEARLKYIKQLTKIIENLA